MDLLVWSHTYSIENETIDAQHKKLMQLLNDLHNVQSAGGGEGRVGGILNDLVDYTVYHFKAEEELQEKNNFPDLAYHKGVHQKLIQDVQGFLELLKNQDQTAKERLMVFLTNWLKDHILGDDKKFGRFLKQNETSVQEDL